MGVEGEDIVKSPGRVPDNEYFLNVLVLETRVFILSSGPLSSAPFSVATLR